MKKSLLFGLLFSAALSMQAQTASNPLPLVAGGENKYEFSGSYSTPVFKYTAPEDQMVTVTSDPTDATFRVTYDGSYSNVAPSVNLKGKTTFIVKKDTDIYVQATVYSSPLILYASAEAYKYNLANTPEDALTVTTGGERIFVPFRQQNYQEVPVYLTYTAPEDGALELVFGGYVHNAEYAVGADGEYVGITCKTTDYTNYRTSIPVEKDKQYYVRLSGSTSCFLAATLAHPVFGESPDYPIIITDGKGEVPAKAGIYYYEVTGTESGYCVISSDVTDFDGTVSFGQRIESNMFTMSDGSFDIRQRATKGGHYYIIVDKKSATAAAQQFNVAFQLPQPYDSEYEGEPVEFGVNTPLPPYAGTYYYKASIPEGAYILKATVSAPFTQEGSSMRIFRENNYTALYIGDPDIICEVDGNTNYIIQVTVAEADKRNNLNVSLSKLQQGDGASDPFIAVVGKNNLPAGDSKYYLYTAEKTSWVVLTPADNSLVNYPSVQRQASEKYPSAVYVTVLKNGDSYRFEAESGEKYLIRYTKVKEDTSFDLALVDYGKGETKENPFAVTSSTLNVPEAPATYWWSYVPSRTGKLHISTDFKYDVVSSPTRENAVSLLNAANSAVLVSLPVDYTEEVFNAASCNVVAGQEYFIRVVSVSEQTGKTVTLELGDLDPGETPANAIEIKPDQIPYEYTFEKNSGGFTTSKWYVIDLQEGELSIYSKQSLTFRVYKEREDNDYNAYNYDFYASTFWGPGYIDRFYGFEKKTITTPGKYYIASYYNYSDVVATIEGSAVKINQDAVDAVGEEANNAPVEYFDLSGRKVINPASGLYIRKQGAKVTKVVLK